MGMTVALLNLKGGVGKSSITYHVGGMLAKSGRRVLVGDFDPQASLTQGFWGPQATRDLPASQSVASSVGRSAALGCRCIAYPG